MRPFVKLENISKTFPGVQALDRIQLEIYPGEVHGLIGENGAGKSTLIKILTGAHACDAGGKIYINERQEELKEPTESMQLGIAGIYQELNIVTQMNVYENVFLGREIKRGAGLINRQQMRQRAQLLLGELGQKIDVDLNIDKLGIGQQQMVEIARSLSIDTKLLIMDEPTASLTEKESAELFKVVARLKDIGIAVLFVSHKLDEVLSICDTITVMRDGRKVETVKNEGLDKEYLIRRMVGRDLENQFPKAKVNIGEEVLRVENLSKVGAFRDVSFKVRRGEIVGFSGLVGAGRTEVMRVVFGVDEGNGGDIYVKGRKTKITCPRDAMAQGMAFLTEDRKGQGLVLDGSIDFNSNIASLEKNKKGFFLKGKELKVQTRRNIQKLNITPASENFVCRQLSGGNQQKVVIAKWLNTEPEIYIIDEPTRGIDVGAKVEVYHVLNELLAKGAAIIMVSSELPEILGLSDRIYVMHDGCITGEVSREEATQEKIMKLATGGNGQ